jgi:hypothetical protein
MCCDSRDAALLRIEKLHASGRFGPHFRVPAPAAKLVIRGYD